MTNRQGKALGLLAFMGLYSWIGQQTNQFFTPILGATNAIWGTLVLILTLIVLMFVAIEKALS